MRQLINIPLSYIDLREAYKKANDIKRGVIILPDNILNWIINAGYYLKEKYYYNIGTSKMVKYYIIIEV